VCLSLISVSPTYNIQNNKLVSHCSKLTVLTVGSHSPPDMNPNKPWVFASYNKTGRTGLDTMWCNHSLDKAGQTYSKTYPFQSDSNTYRLHLDQVSKGKKNVSSNNTKNKYIMYSFYHNPCWLSMHTESLNQNMQSLTLQTQNMQSLTLQTQNMQSLILHWLRICMVSLCVDTEYAKYQFVVNWEYA
jgi:hypothetical protein